MWVEPEPAPSFKDQECNLDARFWNVARLAVLSADLEVMNIPLAHLNVSNYYEDLTLRQLVGHMKCVMDADMSKPIILDEDGRIMDGRHRIMRALLDGTKTIKAVRFAVNPDPCRVEEDNES